MSSGRLVALDRSGRACKQYMLEAGAATLGRDPACDIRLLLPDVWPQHAIIVVHANQTVVRNVCPGETLVNEQPVSVAALRHGDVITIAERRLRWHYDEPQRQRPLSPLPAVTKPGRGGGGGGGGGAGGAARRVTSAAPGAPVSRPALHKTLQIHHRASMPGNAGGKQVAIVQPQRRDTSDQIAEPSAAGGTERAGGDSAEGGTTGAGGGAGRARPSAGGERPLRFAPKTLALHNTTKATLWIESRKSSPRKTGKTSTETPPARRRAASAGGGGRGRGRGRGSQRTPLRLTVLRRAQSAAKATSRVAKIEAPLKIDHMKQAALMLMTGNRRSLNSPALRAKKHSTRTYVSTLEVPDKRESPPLPSPRKSALKDPKRGPRKTESIKFDLSNLETLPRESERDSMLTDEEEDLTLRYSDTSTSPSPRRAIHPNTSPPISPRRSPRDGLVSLESPRKSPSIPNSSANTSRYSRRTTRTVTDHSWDARDTTGESAFPTPSAPNLEAYSIVDLVSIDSNESVYDSVGSTRSSSIVFGTPQSRRTTRSTIDPTLLTSSTPYFKKGRVSTRAHSSPNISTKTSTGSVTRRSQSLTTPENSEETKKHISINSTKISRSSRSRARMNDSDLQFITTLNDGDEESPKTSRRVSTLNRSQLGSSPLKSSPEQLSPSILRKSSPRNINSQIISPRNITSQIMSPRNSLLTSSPQNDSTQASLRSVSLRQSSTGNSSRNSSLKSNSSRNASSLKSSPRDTSSQILSPRNSSTQRSSMRNTSSQILSPQNSSTQKPSLKNKSSQILSPGITSSLSPQNSSTQKSLRNKNSQILSPQNSSTQRSSPRTTISQILSPRNVSSPKSSPRFSRKTDSPKSSSSKSLIARRSRSDLTLDVSQSSQDDDGITTPENIVTPEDIGTPVLSIQSLLDSSQSSFVSQNSPRNTRASVGKRKTIGVLHSAKRSRPSLKSKSFTASVRKSLRSLRLSKDSTQNEDETVTPKSEIKLVQEGVKNKHSTSRKPLSKRSIIDNLNASDIVKQLFNSPVKRKLSQSMTEFSRKKLFDDDDDEEVTRRPARNTVALSGRTPDNSILLDHTERYTPENFVSPLSTPSNSPNLTGIRRLYAKTSPENDLRNVAGVKKLLRTPKLRRSVRNDLTDVRGVRNLYQRKSAANDLRNVSGVKRTFAKSPRNDLSNVRGVRAVFRQEREPEYHDVSGVQELFNESNASHKDAETLFDQLTGKPPIKAVYSKSFLTKRPKKQKTRRTQSLHVPIEQITSNLEGWLEEQLQKHLKKNKANDSTQANVSRALQKLATDTVEGADPIRTGRVRDSTVGQTGTERKRSAAEVYSAHTLPIKKRSLVDKSDKCLKELKVDLSIMNMNNINLPIKKRFVLHSTPVKGKYNITMNASELGRVSPIVAVDKTHNIAAEAQIAKPKVSPKPKGKRATKADVQDTVPLAVPESPKAKGRRTTKAKANVSEITSPKQKRVTRGRNVTAKLEIPAKTTRGKPRKNTESEDVQPTTVTKAKRNAKTDAPAVKSPQSPKPKGKRTANVTENAPEPRTRRTRNNTEKGQIEEKPEPKGKRGPKAKTVKTKEEPVQTIASPKKTRASKLKPTSPVASRSTRNKTDTKTANTRRRRSSLAITKKPPALVPKSAGKATKKNQNKEDSPKTSEEPEKKTARRQKAEVEDKRNSPKMMRAKLVVTKAAKSKPLTKASGSDSDEKKESLRTRRTEDVEAIKPVGKRGRKAVSSPKSSPAPKRGRKAIASPQKSPIAKKGRKNAGQPESEPPAKRGRKNATVVEPSSIKQPGGKDSSQESLPARSSRRNKTVVEPKPQKGRKRKSDEEIDLPAKIAKHEPKTRGRKLADEVTASKSPKEHEETQAVKKSPAKPKVVASKAKKSPVKALASAKKGSRAEVTRSNRRQTAEVQNITAKTQRNTKAAKETAKKSPTKQVEKITRARKVVESIAPPAGRSKRSTKVSSPSVIASQITRSRRR